MPDNENSIFIFEAEPGMKLSRDVVCSDGRLIAQSGMELTMDLITTISDNHVLEINVYKEDASAAPSEPAKELTYFDKIQASPEFARFKEAYNNTVSGVKNNLNDIVFNNKEIEPELIMKETSDILGNSRSNLQIFDMLHSLRANDDLTFVHCINVSLIATIIGRWLKLSEDDLNVLTLCGLLHDIGKLKIPDEVLLKPGRLTDEEYATIKTHVNLGFDQLKNQNIDNRIKEACLLHHEKCDGTGYPFGLRSEKIPLFAKIITVADVYDAMTAARVYRGSMCPFDVIKIMEDDAFSKFDPSILLPFLHNVVSSYLHNNVKLSDGKIGEVVLINNNRLSRPGIMCEGEFIDLSTRPDLTIIEIL